jgi:hypothetical protein
MTGVAFIAEGGPVTVITLLDDVALKPVVPELALIFDAILLAVTLSVELAVAGLDSNSTPLTRILLTAVPLVNATGLGEKVTEPAVDVITGVKPLAPTGPVMSTLLPDTDALKPEVLVLALIFAAILLAVVFVVALVLAALDSNSTPFTLILLTVLAAVN